MSEAKKLYRSTIITRPKTKLAKMAVETRGLFNGNFEYAFRDPSALREWLESGAFDIDATYAFFQTSGNPEADAQIRSKVKDSDGDPKTYRKPLLELFHSRLSELLGPAHMRFPRVQYVGHHSWPHWEDFLWPRTHVLVGNSEKTAERLRNAVCELTSEESYAWYREKEAPHDYLVKEIDALFESGTPPILLADERFEVSGRTLKGIMDFLVPYEYVHHERSYCED